MCWRCDQEEEDVFLRIFRKTPSLLPVFFELLLLMLEEFLRVDEFVHVLAGRDFPHHGVLVFRMLLVLRFALDEN